MSDKEKYLEESCSQYFEFLKKMGPLLEEDLYKGIKMIEAYHGRLYDNVYKLGFDAGRKELVIKQKN